MFGCHLDDLFWNAFRKNNAAEDFELHFKNALHVEIKRAEFLKRYSGTTDTMTEVLPDKTYAVLKPTAHPVIVNARVELFGQLLKDPVSDVVGTKLGEPIFAANQSYSDSRFVGY